ncbi:MAG TPA: hypothetical protein VJ063_10530, partial [Verrucomicrobiae bacterium]|nr:hypothetical protein [Verrucomicrobiae bacterium]
MISRASKTPPYSMPYNFIAFGVTNIYLRIVGMLTRFLTAALLLGAAACVLPQNAGPASIDGAAAEEAYNLSLVVKKVEAHVAAGDLQGVLKYNYVSVKAIQFLLSRPALALPDKQSEVRTALLQFSRALTAVRNAAMNGNHAEAAEAVKELRDAWTRASELYPEGFRKTMSQLSSRLFCPKHGEVTAAEGDRCLKCGRSLQRVDEFCGLPSTDPIIRASALPMEPLKA